MTLHDMEARLEMIPEIYRMLEELLEERYQAESEIPQKKLIDKKQAAEILKVSPITIDRLSDKGEFRKLKVGSQVRFYEHEIYAYAEGRAS